MLQSAEVKHRLRKARKTVIFSLVVNGIVPLVVYTLAHPLLANETLALATAGAIPALRTMALWIWRRRVDWIGLHAIIGFAIACASAALLGGNSFLLKVHGSLLTGTIGAVCLISVAIRHPLLFPLLQAFAPTARPASNLQEMGANRAASLRGSAILTAVIGCALLADAVAHVLLALTLPTDTFLVMSRVANWSILGGGAALLWWMRRQVGTRSSERASAPDGK